MTSIICFVWFIHLLLATLGLTGYYKLSWDFQVQVVGFIFGIFISESLVFPKKSSKLKVVTYNFTKERWITSILLFLLVMAFIYSVYFSMSRGLGLQGVRDAFYSHGNSVSGILTPILWVVTGYVFYSLFCSFYGFFTGKVNGRFLVISLANLVLFSLSLGGRTNLIYLALIIVILSSVLIHCNGDVKLIYRIKGYSKKVAFSMGILIVVVTFIRNGTDISVLLDTYNKYFIGALVAGSEFIDIYSEKLSSLRFGYSFMGLDTLIVSGGLRFIFSSNIESILSETSGIMHYGVRISDTVVTNAHYTVLTPFFIDFGKLGGVVSGLLCGIGYLSAKKKLFKETNLMWVSLYVYLSLLLVYSIRTNVLLEPGLMMTMFICLFKHYFSRKVIISR
ncbi:oligosaccharide repeat unit polymerase [Vibrio diabolicus]|nr:oligosaccharide repeat unit polymerase [Vibrio diabolicus]